MIMIEVEKLRYRYPLTNQLALDNISFKLEKGRFLGVIGANASGKSTLCYALVGLVPHFFKGAYGGRVTIGGLAVGQINASQLVQKIGIVFQNPSNQMSGSKLTVREEIAFGLENLGIPRAEMERRIEEVLELFDLSPYANRDPFSLSGGQMQRLAIASVIAMRPEMIVLDEPTSQLDPQGTEEVFKAVKSLQRQDLTVVMVEHKMEKLAVYADELLLINQGKLIELNETAKVLSRPDLKAMGVEPPKYTQICSELGALEEYKECCPITIDEACYEVARCYGKDRR